MPVFAYQGRSFQGGTLSGDIEAPDRTAAVAELRRRQVFVTGIKEKSAQAWLGAMRGGKVNDKALAI